MLQGTTERRSVGKGIGIGSILLAIFVITCVLGAISPSSDSTSTIYMYSAPEVTPPEIAQLPPLDVTQSTPPKYSPPTQSEGAVTSSLEREVAPESAVIIERSYPWLFQEYERTWDLWIPGSLYDSYQALPRPPTVNYSVYVTHPWDDAYVDNLVEKIESAAAREGLNYLEKLEFTASLVQNLPYTVDSVTTPYNEYPRYPIETLVDKGGDCEDTSILLASLLDRMGYGIVFISFPAKGTEQGHVAVGVQGGEDFYGVYYELNGGKYFYLETCRPGFQVGDIPSNYRDAPAFLYELEPVSVITHDWNGKVFLNTAELEVSIENLGTVDANGIYVYAGFYPDGDMQWNPVESQRFDLAMGQSATVNLTLQLPVNRYARLIIEVVDEEDVVDERHYSTPLVKSRLSG